MFYTYILKQMGSGRIYIGFSKNLRERIKTHQKTKDIKLVYYEAYFSEEDARKRERDLKEYRSAIGHLKKRIQKSFHEA